MAPLPSNSTACLFVDYNVSGENHTVLCRFGTLGSASDAMNVVDGVLTALTSSLNLLTIVQARTRILGGSVSSPITWTGAASYGSASGQHNETAQYIDFVGRSLGGVRCRFAVFGFTAPFDGSGHDYRFSAAASPQVANALVALRADPNTPVAADGDVVNWHDYGNVGVNAYWRNRIR